MKTNLRTSAFLPILIFLLIGIAKAEEVNGEFIINTLVAVKAVHLFPSQETIRYEPPSPAASIRPSPSPEIPGSARRELSGLLRGEKTENILFTTSLITLTGLHIADYISTRQALKYPALKEGNPLMKPFAKNAVLFAAVKAGTAALSYYGLHKVFKRNKTAAWILTMTSNLILSYVVANNMSHIRSARGS